MEEKIVALNGMKRTLYGDKEMQMFEKTSFKIKSLESYVANYIVDGFGEKVTYYFGFDKNNMNSNFELTFIFRDNLNLVELKTTSSNQYINDDFIELLNLLNDIKKEGI